MKITLTELKTSLGVDTASKKGDFFTVRRGFFYRHGKTAQDLVDRVKTTYPNAEIIDSGEIYKAFSGGAPVSKQSHWWVKFKLPIDGSLIPKDEPIAEDEGHFTFKCDEIAPG